MLGVASLIYTQFILWLQDYIPLAISESLHACRSAACKKMFFSMRQHEPDLAPVSFHWVRNSNKSSISSRLKRQSAVLSCVWHPEDVFFFFFWRIIHNYCYKLMCEMRLLTGVWHSFCCMADIHHLQLVWYNSHWWIVLDLLCTQR